jgi:hypothetical protein
MAMIGIGFVALVTRLAWPESKPAPQAQPTYHVDSVLVADAVIASGVCHAWLRTDRKRADSLHSLNYEHVGPGSGKTFPCMTWLIMNGEKP